METRKLFRFLIKTALVLCIVAACTDSLYFMQELSNDNLEKYNYRYHNNRYYNTSSMENTEEVDEYIDTIQVNGRSQERKDYYY